MPYPEYVFWLELFILCYLLWLNTCYTGLLIVALFAGRRRFKELRAENIYTHLKSESLPPISILIPTHNEEKTIDITVKNSLNFTYPEKQIIVVNDGSEDRTLEVLKESFSLIPVPVSFLPRLPTEQILSFYKSRTYPNMLVIDKIKGGKGDALNAGINACVTPLFFSIDSDTLLDDKGMDYLLRPCLTNANTVVAGASIRLVNGCEVVGTRILKPDYPNTLLTSFQAIEYIRGFFIGRLGWNFTEGSLIVAGAFSLFRTDIVRKVGGFNKKSISEDMELVVAIHHYMHDMKQDYKIAFIPDPVAFTEGPEDLHSLGRQRRRWHTGLIQCLWRNREMLFNPRYGYAGMVTFPFFLFGEALAPVVEALGYGLIAYQAYHQQIHWDFWWPFLVVSWGFTTMLSFISIIASDMITYQNFPRAKHIFRIFLFAILENFGYRQLTVYWRLRAFPASLMKQPEWGDIKRSGFHPEKFQS